MKKTVNQEKPKHVKIVREAQKTSEERYKSYIELTGQLAWVTNHAGEVVEDIPSFRNFTGQTYDEVKGTGWASALHPDDVGPTMEVWRDAVSARSSYETEYRIKRHDGEYCYFIAKGFPVLDKKGNISEWIGTCIDITERKKSEIVIKDNERRFRELIEALPQLFWTCRVDGPCDYLSKQWVEYTGIPEKDQLVYGWLEQLHSEDRDKTVSEWMEKVKTGDSFDIEFRIRRNDGVYHWFKTRAVPMHDSDGNIIKWLGSNTDIDEIKRAQEQLGNFNRELEQKVDERTAELKTSKGELQMSRQRLLLHVQQTPLAVVEFDIAGIISDWNPAAEKIFGYSHKEALGNFWTFIVPEKFHPALEGVWESLISQKGGSRSSNENVTKDGKTIICEWFNTPLIDQNGNTIGVASLIMDITERNRAEEIIRNSEKELREYLDVTPFPIAIVDTADSNINFWSRSALTLFGHTAPTSKEWYDLAYPDPNYQNEVVERWKPKLELAKSSSTPINTGEYNITCHDGSVRICELYIAFLKEKLIVTFNDITGRKVAEEEVRKHRDHLEELVNERTMELDNAIIGLKRSNQELEQFAYVASHDLQEPLRMVSSYTQLLERRYKDQLDQDAKDFIFFAVDGANRMQHLINDLLDYSRVTTRGKPFVKLDLSAVLGHAIANLQKKIQETGAMIVNDDLPFVYGDEVQLVRVFQNLLDNAMKFRGAEPPRINVSAKTVDDKIQISLTDNGIGIDKIYFERVFTIFQRLHTKVEYPGTGIGLAICKRTIERHGGKIWFESEPGKGTTFFFTLNFKS